MVRFLGLDEALEIVEKLPNKIKEFIDVNEIRAIYDAIKSIHLIPLGVSKITITRDEEEAIKSLGLKIGFSCYACCGFGYIERIENIDNTVTYVAVPCECHPNAFLSLFPQ